MDWKSALEDVIQRYSGQAGGAAAAPENPHADFQQVAQAAPQGAVADGLSQAFRSDRTPPFSEMVADLFSRSDPNQRAGLLNRLLGSGNLTPQQASQISPVQVQQMAAQAERQNPSVVDEVSSFYAQHPQLMHALGAAALTIALQHILNRR
jgi:hypothetical protein